MAIALDAVSTPTGNEGSGNLTVSHTCTGDDRILFVGFHTDADDVTSVTYATVAMTRVATSVQVAGDKWCHLFYLVAPATGANNIVVSATTDTSIFGYGVSYTGAAQSGQPDSSATNAVTGTTSIALATTVVAEDCWLVCFAKNDIGNFGVGAGTTARGGAQVNQIADSNGTVSTGSQSLNLTYSSGDAAGVVASFKPFVASATTSNFMLLGVGT